ncbi:putative RNA recognition motif protein [Toxoplasma gondii GAB2-2007-GAL-DOM2]|uniref:RRM domain-containing protein n=6 Tax=Toxoplasma gondii TaxID=5811 RepID=S7UYQ4_TOXGG|nr:hypothetical protein TGGT1_258610 [Toxoplasma gondii GT1]KAF4641336.1 hypothetical protein TGRH88_071460 [Toxoplasma gondii]KFG33801.1 putative RNA recognition motif protein [Toxoplasma gondii GAB2-2007-GAL-DOM2]KFG37997.1 putative RNA recognition motif protein [Toxoplasma gondii FOU]PUA84216.1 putative RNA recognition motif protein [Toxoplasma gondii TgCATBr9]RQX71141.1 putative RNA recognition motif protein [Toxoplasma gondii CAST]
MPGRYAPLNRPEGHRENGYRRAEKQTAKRNLKCCHSSSRGRTWRALRNRTTVIGNWNWRFSRLPVRSMSSQLFVLLALAAAAQPGDASWFIASRQQDSIQKHLAVGFPSETQWLKGSEQFCHVSRTTDQRPTSALSVSRSRHAVSSDIRECTPAEWDATDNRRHLGVVFAVPPPLRLIPVSPVSSAAAFLGDIFSWRRHLWKIPGSSSALAESILPPSQIHRECSKPELSFLCAFIPSSSVVHRLSLLIPAPLHPSVSGSTSSSALHVYRNKFLHINPVRRVKHLKRNSGRSHVHELARERYLLHRQKDVRDYYRMKIRPHVDTCPHSQRNAAIKKPYQGVNEARKEENRRLNAEDDLRDEARIALLRAFLDSQSALVPAAGEADDAVWTEVEGNDGDRDSPQRRGNGGVSDVSELASFLPGLQDTGKKSGGDGWATFSDVKKACEELQLLLRKRRMLRPLGSHKLFVSGVDDRLMNSDLEDFFDFFFRKTKVKLHKNADGTHRGSGLIMFETTLDATRCLLEFNGVRMGAKRLFLAEALGPPLKPKVKKEYVLPAFPFGPSSSATQAGTSCGNISAP